MKEHGGYYPRDHEGIISEGTGSFFVGKHRGNLEQQEKAEEEALARKNEYFKKLGRKKMHCLVCGRVFYRGTSTQVLCGRERCRVIRSNEKSKLGKRRKKTGSEAPPPPRQRTCKYCQRKFTPKRAGVGATCGRKECQRKHKVAMQRKRQIAESRKKGASSPRRTIARKYVSVTGIDEIRVNGIAFDDPRITPLENWDHEKV